MWIPPLRINFFHGNWGCIKFDQIMIIWFFFLIRSTWFLTYDQSLYGIYHLNVNYFGCSIHWVVFVWRISKQRWDWWYNPTNEPTKVVYDLNNIEMCFIEHITMESWLCFQRKSKFFIFSNKWNDVLKLYKMPYSQFKKIKKKTISFSLTYFFKTMITTQKSSITSLCSKCTMHERIVIQTNSFPSSKRRKY